MSVYKCHAFIFLDLPPPWPLRTRISGWMPNYSHKEAGEPLFLNHWVEVPLSSKQTAVSKQVVAIMLWSLPTNRPSDRYLITQSHVLDNNIITKVSNLILQPYMYNPPPPPNTKISPLASKQSPQARCRYLLICLILPLYPVKKIP